jgi:hypothetical protein
MNKMQAQYNAINAVCSLYLSGVKLLPLNGYLESTLPVKEKYLLRVHLNLICLEFECTRTSLPSLQYQKIVHAHVIPSEHNYNTISITISNTIFHCRTGNTRSRYLDHKVRVYFANAFGYTPETWNALSYQPSNAYYAQAPGKSKLNFN